MLFKIKSKRYFNLLSGFSLSNNARTANKFNNAGYSSDFWIIPEVRNRWNEKCTGDPGLSYEDYTVSKYLAGLKDLRLLSIGCGTGTADRKFAKYPVFSLVEGIDLAENLIDEARTVTADLNLGNIRYHAGDFLQHKFEPESFDVILFHSSLHHFRNINQLLKNKVRPLLRDKGYLIVFEYVGPDRLQWTSLQIERANEILMKIPEKYRYRFNSKSVKCKNYRPGLLRMYLIDPSEAPDSGSILPSLHEYFKVIEEKKLGWDITHILLKDISHNFLNSDTETRNILSYIFEEEDKYLEETGNSDAVFGIYRKA